MDAPAPNTIALGARAEEAAARLLLDRGYRIVERNYRCASGELDLVARDGDVLVFVEVRSRADGEHGEAAEMIDRRKQRQVSRVAAHYLAARCPAFEQARFDVVAITGDQLELIQDAWRL
ncbi:MAG: YraN family protein [Kofleriaceae bacterium]